MTSLDKLRDVKNDIKNSIERQFVIPEGGITTYADAIRNIQKSAPLEGDYTGLKFYGCTEITYIPMIDTSKYTDMSGMFYSCNSLKIIPRLDCGNVKNISSMFHGTYHDPKNRDEKAYLGGLKDLGKQIEFEETNTLDLTIGGYIYNTKIHVGLAKISYLNVFYDLWDRSSNIYPTMNIRLDFNDINEVGITENDLAIVTNKGWTIELI